MINKKTLFFYFGSGVSQIITLLTTLYVINHVSPSAFGIFSYCVAIGSIVGSLSTLKYELSITISKDSAEAYDKVNLTFFISLVLNIVLVGMYGLGFMQGNWYNIVLVLFLANAVSFNASLQQLLLYTESHNYNGLYPVIIAVLNYFFLVAVFKGESGLLISYVLANFAATLIFLVLLWISGFRLKLYTLSYYKKIAFSNLSYPKYILPGTISIILLTYFHPILLGFVYSKQEVGLFSFSLRILLLPTIIVGAVLSGLLRAKLSKLYYDNQLSLIRTHVLTVIKWLSIACLVLFPCIIVGIYCLKYIINMHKWAGVEQLSVYLVLYAISQFFYQPLTNIALVFNKGKLLLKLNVIQLFLTVFLYLIAYIFKFSFVYFLNALSVVLFTFTIYASIKFFNIVRNTDEINIS